MGDLFTLPQNETITMNNVCSLQVIYQSKLGWTKKLRYCEKRCLRQEGLIKLFGLLQPAATKLLNPAIIKIKSIFRGTR